MSQIRFAGIGCDVMRIQGLDAILDWLTDWHITSIWCDCESAMPWHRVLIAMPACQSKSKRWKFPIFLRNLVPTATILFGANQKYRGSGNEIGFELWFDTWPWVATYISFPISIYFRQPSHHIMCPKGSRDTQTLPVFRSTNLTVSIDNHPIHHCFWCWMTIIESGGRWRIKHLQNYS